jgi:hypothetical protein
MIINILLGHRKANQVELHIFAERIFKKMNSNPRYFMLQTVVTVLGTLVNDYKTAIFDQDGSEAKQLVKAQLREDLRTALTKLARKIMPLSDDMPDEEAKTFVTETGFKIAQEVANKTTIDYLPKPTKFDVVNDKRKAGAALLTYNRVVGAIMYVFEELDDNNIWQNCGSTTALSFSVSGGKAESKRTFRMKASGAGDLESEYTDPVSVWVR